MLFKQVSKEVLSRGTGTPAYGLIKCSNVLCSFIVVILNGALVECHDFIKCQDNQQHCKKRAKNRHDFLKLHPHSHPAPPL